MDSMAMFIIVTVFVANFCLYTSYDKSTRRLSLSKLLEVLCFRKGIVHTFKELNKVLALVGLAVLGIAFIPQKQCIESQDYLLVFVLYSQIIHSVFSVWCYYGEHIPKLNSWAWAVRQLFSSNRKDRLICIKLLSTVFAFVCLILLVLFQLNIITITMTAVCFFGVAHFWTMEVDFKLNLSVRPFGYFPFITVLIALFCVLFYVCIEVNQSS